MDPALIENLDPVLKEKIAFFERLEAFDNPNDDEVLDEEEQSIRDKSKSFFRNAASSSSTKPKPKPTSRISRQLSGDTRPQGAASDPIPQPIGMDDDVQIIAVTPVARTTLQKTKAISSLGKESSDPQSTVPETARPQARSLPRRTSHPQFTATKRFASETSASRSNPAGKKKKKKPTPLKMVPVSQQLFKGLTFFYILDNDVNAVRSIRITKAREYGAIWTREIGEATHIIVDRDLKYEDVEPVLVKGNVQLSILSKKTILVNDLYPLDCLRRKTIRNPDMVMYRVAGAPSHGPAADTANPPPLPSSQDSSISLQLKPRQTRTSKKGEASSNITSQSSDNSPQRRTSVDPLCPSSNDQALGEGSARASASKDRLDELALCITEVRENPDMHIGSDDDSADIGNCDVEEGYLSDDGVSAVVGAPKKRSTEKRPGAAKQDDQWQSTFNCMHGGTRGAEIDNPNAKTIAVLQKMKEEHELMGDKLWQVAAYTKAIGTLRQQPKMICTAAEARNLPNIGKIAEKIEEIVRTGSLRQLEEAEHHPHRQALSLFLKIYGVGHSQAHRWVADGFRTLEDLRTKAHLSDNQKIGIDHYNELRSKIPRDEVTALGECIKDAMATIDPQVELIVGGSYRRGADESGDIDLIVTKPGTRQSRDLKPVVDRLVDTLTKSGFLTAALAAHRDGVGSSKDGSGSKWHGCCVLPRDAYPGPKADYRPTWRRIDFLLVPETELGAALIYFTGNDVFNRSIRWLAHKKGWKLNQKALTGPGFSEGKDERKIFDMLKVPWREPHDRCC